jgi:guanylate kinase
MESWVDRKVGFPLVVSGPSGVGKTSLVDHLLKGDRRCVRSISSTTRPIRAGEVDGESYCFVDEEQFLQLRDRHGFAESARYNGAWYGTPKAALDARLATGSCVVLNIEVVGGLQIREHYPEAVLVFVLPPSWEELRRRLLGRGTDAMEVVEARIRRAREEVESIDRYDYVIINDDLARCAGDLAAVVRAERRSVPRLSGPPATKAE